jgi:ATP-dependent helicase HrpA
MERKKINPHDLPVYKEKARILEALEQHSVIVVESPTGSGKTTQLPLILHEAGYTKKGVVGITQPRRIATLSVSEYIAKQIDAKIGDFIGYKMRFEDITSQETRLKIMTDGTLLQEMKHDPLLSGYSVLMVDEAHERSLNIDFILGLLKTIIAQRPEFKVIISSATINSQIFKDYFDDCPVVYIDTPVFPVDLHYMELDYGQRQDEALVDRIQMVVEREVVGKIEKESKGDILIFLPGEKNIKDTVAALSGTKYSRDLLIIPLYGRLSKEEQERVFIPTPKGKTKIVVSTNIAETSITIDGITVVIDSGLAKLNHYNPRTFTSSLIETPVSKASANQRKGRAGRTQPGTCYRLYSKKDFDQRPLYTLEEILRTDLSEVVLRMSELGIRDFESFDFLSPPGKSGIYGAVETLSLLDALAEDNSLTKVGQMMALFPLLPRHSRILIEAVHRYPDVIYEATVATAFLSTGNPYLLPQGEEIEARKAHHTFRDPAGDFVSYLRLFDKYAGSRKKDVFCQTYYLDRKSMDEIVNVQVQLEEIISRQGIPISSGGTLKDYLCAIAKGLIQFVCVSAGRGTYRSLTAEKILIHPGSVLFQERPAFIVAGEIVRTSRMWARSVSTLQKEWLKDISPALSSDLKNLGKPDGSGNYERQRGEGPQPSKNDRWTVSVGRETFPLKRVKGKKVIASLPWIRLKNALSNIKTSQLPNYKNIRGQILVGEKTIFTGMKLNRILEITKKLDPDKHRLSQWPKGKNFYMPNQFHLLAEDLRRVMYYTQVRRKSLEMGFLTLMTDGRGQYWFKVMKSFDEALSESLASLEYLADEISRDIAKEQWGVVNETYRRLNGYIAE